MDEFIEEFSGGRKPTGLNRGEDSSSRKYSQRDYDSAPTSSRNWSQSSRFETNPPKSYDKKKRSIDELKDELKKSVKPKIILIFTEVNKFEPIRE